MSYNIQETNGSIKLWYKVAINRGAANEMTTMAVNACYLVRRMVHPARITEGPLLDLCVGNVNSKGQGNLEGTKHPV